MANRFFTSDPAYSVINSKWKSNVKSDNGNLLLLFPVNPAQSV